ncbi:hypothetical protein OG497_37575 [Streptomyces sp. NBC_01242]|uniref:hypothetical protein n=1 Tax=Streptomyces sp. NBC_01242 TaxID=2903795 RepID=UPI00225553DB|nr:hypothetical protein [Streptomyces sp. NBC_01242]MCX4799568.1 hypothetical protein [Streptomyces sp. NBC_01242]
MQVQRIQVSNPSPEVVVLTPDADRPKSYLRFEGKGDAEGGDVQFISREDVLQTPFIKAVKRGVLTVDTDLVGDVELESLLRVTISAKAAKEPQKLTATRVVYVYDEDDETYNRVEKDIPVIIEPLSKV